MKRREIEIEHLINDEKYIFSLQVVKSIEYLKNIGFNMSKQNKLYEEAKTYESMKKLYNDLDIYYKYEWIAKSGNLIMFEKILAGKEVTQQNISSTSIFLSWIDDEDLQKDIIKSSELKILFQRIFDAIYIIMKKDIISSLKESLLFRQIKNSSIFSEFIKNPIIKDFDIIKKSTYIENQKAFKRLKELSRKSANLVEFDIIINIIQCLEPNNIESKIIPMLKNYKNMMTLFLEKHNTGEIPSKLDTLEKINNLILELSKKRKKQITSLLLSSILLLGSSYGAPKVANYLAKDSLANVYNYTLEQYNFIKLKDTNLTSVEMIENYKITIIIKDRILETIKSYDIELDKLTPDHIKRILNGELTYLEEILPLEELTKLLQRNEIEIKIYQKDKQSMLYKTIIYFITYLVIISTLGTLEIVNIKKRWRLIKELERLEKEKEELKRAIEKLIKDYNEDLNEIEKVADNAQNIINNINLEDYDLNLHKGLEAITKSQNKLKLNIENIRR
ncbi:MAG: hypothetical protein HFE04_00080 [Bacilli bacterium]|nr:hypothetical protein [Bacilli bacterium]